MQLISVMRNERVMWTLQRKQRIARLAELQEAYRLWAVAARSLPPGLVCSDSDEDEEMPALISDLSSDASSWSSSDLSVERFEILPSPGSSSGEATELMQDMVGKMKKITAAIKDQGEQQEETGRVLSEMNQKMTKLTQGDGTFVVSVSMNASEKNS